MHVDAACILLSFLRSCTYKRWWYAQLTPRELYIKIQSHITNHKNEDGLVMCSFLHVLPQEFDLF